MGLTNKEKVRLQDKRLKYVGQKAALVYAYDPASDRWLYVMQRGAFAEYLFSPILNCWLPAQCDDEGRLVIASGE